MSALVVAAVAVPLAPVGMLVAHWLGRRAAERRQRAAFADDVERWLVIRDRG